MIPSRGKHREFAQVSTQQSLRSSATHAERRSRTAPFHSSPPPSPSVPPLTFPSLRNLSLPFRHSYLSAPRSLHSLCLFRVFAVECHNFCESLRFGRRWVETRTANPHQTNRLQKTCREPRRNPRAAALPRCRLLPLAYPSVVVRFSTAMSLSLSFFPSPQPRVLSRSSMPVPHPSPVSLNFITARCRPVSRCNMIVANEKVAKRENRLRVTNVD